MKGRPGTRIVSPVPPRKACNAGFRKIGVKHMPWAPHGLSRWTECEDRRETGGRESTVCQDGEKPCFLSFREGARLPETSRGHFFFFSFFKRIKRFPLEQRTNEGVRKGPRPAEASAEAGVPPGVRRRGRAAAARSPGRGLGAPPRLPRRVRPFWGFTEISESVHDAAPAMIKTASRPLGNLLGSP